MKENNKNKKETKTKQNPKKLTKGLDAIFGDNFQEVLNDIEGKQRNVMELDLKLIEANPFQPRRHFDNEKLQDLANSIKKQGLLSPIVVRANESGNYYIIAGERRFRASRIANKKTISAILIDKITDKKMQELALIENIQRENLNPIEEASGIKQLIDNHNLTHEEASKILGKSRSHITNSLRLLKLDKRLIDAVLKGELTFGHTKPLVGLDEQYISGIYERIINDNWTVRDVENSVRAYKLRLARKLKTRTTREKGPEIEFTEGLIRSKIKSKVKISNNKITIPYKDNNHLNRILENLGIIKD